jgi:hypothetical protein
MEFGADSAAFPTQEPPMKTRRSLDAGLLALLTVAFSVLCFGAVVLDLRATPDVAAAGTSAAAGPTGTPA